MMLLLAIVLAAVVSVALGMLWFSHLMFGKKWMELSGIDPAKMSEECKDGKKSMWKSMVGNTLLTLVTSFIVFTLLYYGISMVGVFAIWCAFSLPVFANSVFWAGKPVKLFLIEAGYSLVSLAFMSQIILWLGF